MSKAPKQPVTAPAATPTPTATTNGGTTTTETSAVTAPADEVGGALTLRWTVASFVQEAAVVGPNDPQAATPANWGNQRDRRRRLSRGDTVAASPV